MTTLFDAAAQLHQLLERDNHIIVFAESCTAGLVAATMGRIPGISQWLAGSAVTYQIETKAQWLDVGRDVLQNPGPVSQIVSEQMARGALHRTAQATVAASVTGHLGPDAPIDQDGTAWITVASRRADTIATQSRQLKLDDELVFEPNDRTGGHELRCARQKEAARLLLLFCIEQLS